MRIAKRAQLSWFVVLGIVFLIILGVISWLAYSMQFTKPSQVLASEEIVSKVKNYVESCEKELAEEALILIGNQGGKINPEKYFFVSDNKVSYGIPCLEDISKDVGDYIDKNLRNCKPESVTKKEVRTSKPETSVRFNDKETVVETEWTITLMLENNTEYNINSVKVSLPVRMKLVHGTLMQDLKTVGTDLNFVNSLDGMDVKKIKYGDDVLGVLIDHKSKLKDKPYRFFYVS